MSTIASPRPSITLSSRRGSASSANTITSTATSSKPPTSPAVDRPERGSLRRNRAALRDYYGLKNAAPSDGRDTSSIPSLDAERESELDKPGFEPQSYVHTLLSTEGLEGVLKVEAGLVSDIRSLDGEKKALVYDNYSKLIAATDTIRSMREKMDPMTPTTSTLTPAIQHIAETASTLTTDLRKASGGNAAREKSKGGDKSVQVALVRWVLAAPERIQGLVELGKNDEAVDDWKRVEAVLDQWKDVPGTDDVRQRCPEIISKAEE